MRILAEILIRMSMLRRSLIVVPAVCALSAQAQWSQVNSGITDLAQGATVLGATSDHLIARAGWNMYRSSNDGDSWSVIQPPVAFNSTECGYFRAGRYFAGMSASGDCIYFTNDNGDTWNSVTGAPTATVVRGFHELGTALYAYTSNLGIYRSTNNGDSWQAVNVGLSNLNVFSMGSIGTHLFACTIGGGVFVSADAGASWSPSNVGIAGGDLNGEHVWRMGNELYYTAQGGGKYRSTDLGANWSVWAWPSLFGVGLLEVQRFGGNLYIETRHFTGVYRDSVYTSSDEGLGWTNITGNLNAADLNGSGLVALNGYVFLGYNMMSPGQGIYRRSIATGIDDLIPAAEQAPAVYPNPAHDLLTIQTSVHQGPMKYTLVDIAGVAVLNGSMTSATAVCDVSALAPGAYLLRWNDGRVPPVRIIKQ